ncbi:MAG: hypothetical protein ACLPV4_19880 [Solirubrobacteraceae bacterium]
MNPEAPPAGEHAGLRRWSRPWALHHAGRLWPWTPVGVAAIYLVALVVTLGSLVRGIYVSSDAAAAPVIGELSAHAPANAQITLGNIPWYSAFWFEQLTHELPAHRQLWEVTPWIFVLIAIGLVAWAPSRVAGRWAGALVAVTCACAGAELIPLQFAWSVHAVSYAHICLLGAVTVPLALTERWIGGRVWVHVLLLVLLGIVTGIGVACDELVIVAGLVPFAVAGIVLTYFSHERVRWWSLASVAGVVLLSIVVALLVRQIARSEHLVPAKFPITFAPANQLLNHFGDLLGSLTVIGNGNFGGAPLTMTSSLSFVCAVVVLLGTYAAVRLGTRAVLAALPREALGDLRSVSPRRARATFLAFWITSTLAVSLAFVVSSVPVGLGTSRYIVTAGYGLVVILAVGVAGQSTVWRRALLTLGVSIVAAASVVSLLEKQVQQAQPDSTAANAVLSYAISRHVSVAYAGYWDSLGMTWELHDALPVYPVIGCGNQLCQFPYHKISSWFTPRTGVRSLLVVDPTLAVANTVGGPSAALGKPLTVATVDGLQLYVYGYDIASKLGPG